MAGHTISPGTLVEQRGLKLSRVGFRYCAKVVSAALALSSILVFHPQAALGGGGPRNVLLVINRASEASRTIGAHYRAARNIPRSNICYITCSTEEVVPRSEVEGNIREPIRQYIVSNGLEDKIDYIVLTKGIPLAANYGDCSGPYSVTSILTAVSEPSYLGPFVNPYGPTALSAWETAAPQVAWSHQLAFQVKGTNPPIYRHFYLVTRLDGYSTELVNDMIDRSVALALDGKFVLDRNPALDGNISYRMMNNRLGAAANLLAQRELDTYQDNTTAFIGGMAGLMGYFSWGSNELSYLWPKYASNLFIPGAIADTYVSSSARTFNAPSNWVPPPDPNSTQPYPGQSLIGDLLVCGLCGAAGYVSEPYGSLTSYADVLFDRYTNNTENTKGFNMAESFYAACPELFWKTAIVGDPLMAPYSTPPIVAFTNPGGTITGVATIQAEAVDEGPIAKVDFYFDDRFVGSDTTAPYGITVDTRQYSVGAHTTEAIAYENSPAATQGYATTTMYVANQVSNCARISQALDYAEGQIVRLTDKVVTSAAGSIPGVFYIEEGDRSSGIRVSCADASVVEGSLVEVQGPVSVVGAEKTILSAAVTVAGSGQAPQPVTMTLATMRAGASDVGKRIGIRPTGLLVKTAGRVAAIETGGILLDSGPGTPTICVKSSQALQVGVGNWVSIVGILSAADGPSGQILVRKSSDVTIIR